MHLYSPYRKYNIYYIYTIYIRYCITGIHSRRMNLMRGIDFVKIAEKMNNASGAECKAICTEAGMFYYYIYFAIEFKLIKYNIQTMLYIPSIQLFNYQ